MKIAIDIGHNCKFDNGAVGVKTEDECTLEIGTKVKDKLAALGHTIIDCTPTNVTSLGDSLMQRCNKSNNGNAELFVSIHLNAYNGSAKGTEVYYFSPKGKEIADKVLPELVALGFQNRGVKQNTYYVLRNTNAVAILIECCFVDNVEDMNLYDAEKIANAIVMGLVGQLPEKHKYWVKTENMFDEYVDVAYYYKKYFSGCESFYAHASAQNTLFLCSQYLTKIQCEDIIAAINKDGLVGHLVIE